MKPRFFKAQADFRAWLEKHGQDERELWVGFYKKNSGKTGLAYMEAVDEALCFGWIDGIVKRVDEVSFMHRFSPRTKTSTWSLINIKRVAELTRLGLMAEPGLNAFRERDEKRSGIYLYELRDQPLAPAFVRRFKADARAWKYFRALPPGYQRMATMWIMTAKKEETRLRRLDQMIKASSANTRIRWI